MSSLQDESASMSASVSASRDRVAASSAAKAGSLTHSRSNATVGSNSRILRSRTMVRRRSQGSRAVSK